MNRVKQQLSKQRSVDSNSGDSERLQEHQSDMAFLKTVVEPNQFADFFQIRASEAMASALFAFMKYYKNPEDCLVRLISYGGDADTTAAICGALLGALYGSSWIPSRWFNNLENQAFGRDCILNASTLLSTKDFANDRNILI